MNKDNRDFFLVELLLFGLIGCLGGVFGAFFVRFNGMITQWRKVNSSFVSLGFVNGRFRLMSEVIEESDF